MAQNQAPGRSARFAPSLPGWGLGCWQDGVVPIERIDHVQLAMPPGGEPAARAFYMELLGIPERPKPANLAKRGGCVRDHR